MINLVKLNNTSIQINVEAVNFANPNYIYLPNFYANNYKKNDYIFKNSRVSDIISSISGYIEDMDSNTIKIRNDFQENQKKNKKNNIITSYEELIKSLDNSYFKNIKEKIEELKDIKQIAVTSVDEEVYEFNEVYRLRNNYREVLDTTDKLIKILEASSAIICTKNTSLDNIKRVNSIIGMYPNLSMALLPDKYLISYKNFLCNYLNLESCNTLVLTCEEIYSICELLNGINKTEKLITISGTALEKSKIINARMYCSLKEIVDNFFSIKESNYDIHINGYLKGEKIDSISKIIITPFIDSVVINTLNREKETECINCGACQKICPYDINVRKHYFDKTIDTRCIGCGLCTYICPARIELKSKVYGGKNAKQKD